MFANLNFRRIAKALFATAATLSRTDEHRRAVAVTIPLDCPIREASKAIGIDPVSANAKRGLAIPRSLPTQAAAEWFVHQMQSFDLTGERTWRALWDFYLWLCEEENLIPLPETMQAQFAHELSKLCRRGQIRLRDGGQLRRLTTYTVPKLEAVCLRAAA